MPGHLARAGFVLGRLLRAGPVPVHFAPAGPVVGDSARALPAHFARAGPLCAFAWAGQVLEHFAQPVLGYLVRAVQARLVPVHLPWPPKLGIASTRLQMDPR